MTFAWIKGGGKSRGSEAAPALFPPFFMIERRHLESPAVRKLEMESKKSAAMLLKGRRGERSHRMRPVMWERETIGILIVLLRFNNFHPTVLLSYPIKFNSPFAQYHRSHSVGFLSRRGNE